jgi:hypothetical protein
MNSATNNTETDTMTTNDFNKTQDATRERMLRELMDDLNWMVRCGDITSEQANDWYNMKADQWN